MKRPAFQFYADKWQSDKDLRRCSIGARGLWIELMCVMHTCVPYGHLADNDGSAMGELDAAQLCGVDRKQYRELLAEIERKGVSSRTADGVLYSRRMVKDETARNARGEGGKEGAGHGYKGAEHGHKGGRPTPEKLSTRGVIEPPSKPPLAVANEGTKGGFKPPIKPPPVFVSVSVSKTEGLEVTTVPSPDEKANGKSNPEPRFSEIKNGKEHPAQHPDEPAAAMLKLPHGWRTEDSAADQAGRLLGMRPGGTESYDDYRRRIGVAYEAYRLNFLGLRTGDDEALKAGQ